MKRIITSLFALIIAFTIVLGVTSCKSEKEKLVDQPSEVYVIECLQKVPCIIDIEAVTEDNDPIGQLNKPGGYTALVYFSYELVNQEEVYGDDLIDKGTDAGGSIEVYRTKDDANKRNDYLATFDGTVLASGSHKVIGTVVVRTSDELTASQQNLLEANIIAALNGELNKIVTPNNGNNSNNENGQNKEPEEDINQIIDRASALSAKDNLSQEETKFLLISEGYTLNNVVRALNSSNINWKLHAKNRAEGYEDLFATISPSMVSQLLLETFFTDEEVEYALENAEIDWKYFAVIHAEDYCRMFDNITPLNVQIYLECEKGYSVEDATYAVNQLDINWSAYAVSFIEYVHENNGPYAYKNSYYSDLEDHGFSKTQIDYAIENCYIDWIDIASDLVDICVYKSETYYGFCEEHGAFKDNKNLFRCPICRYSCNSLVSVYTCSKNEAFQMLLDAGFTNDESTVAINEYYDVAFEYSENEELWLARFCLSEYLIAVNSDVSKEEARMKLRSFGYSDEVIKVALLDYYKPDFEIPVLAETEWVSLAMLKDLGYYINERNGNIEITHLNYDEIEFIITGKPNIITGGKVYNLLCNGVVVKYIYSGNSNYVYELEKLDYDSLITLGIIKTK
jgi:hypothetical protein